MNRDFRPIEARTLKSICDTLRPYFSDRVVLDLYAGSGRLGLAALENGSSRAVFVERDGSLARDLKPKIPAKSRTHCRIVTGDSLDFLGKTTREFDLIFADPPFRIWSSELAESLLRGASAALNPDGIFLVRWPKRVLISVTDTLLRELNLRLWKESRQGEAILWYFTYEPKTKDENEKKEPLAK